MRTYFIFILLIAVTLVHGQKDEAAEPYLDKISTDLAPDHAIHINFDYIRQDLQSETQVEGSGSLVLMGEMYKMELDEVMVFFNGKKQYSLNKEVEEVYISIPDPDDKDFLFSQPIKLLRNYKEEFKYKLMGDATILGVNAVEVQLYPEELGGPYALLKLFFSHDRTQIKAIVIRQKDGIIYTMIVTEMSKKEDPGVNYFQFNAVDYPNVDVIELLN